MEKMKKIIIYNGQLFMGGIERVLLNYLIKLSKIEDVQIELLIKENNPQKNIFEKEVPSNIKISYIKSPEMIEKREEYSMKKKKSIYYKMMYVFTLKKEREYMRNWLKEYFEGQKNVDAVIDFDMSLGKYLDTIKGIPRIGWVHYSLEARKGRKRKRFEKRLEKYEKVIVICDEMKKEMQKIHSDAYPKTQRIYNPFNIELIKERSNDIGSLSNDEVQMLKENYIVGVSRLVKSKGREDLIRSFKDAKEKGLKEKLYLLGEGVEKENLRKLISELSLENEVFLLGQKVNPYPWMKNAKLFAHTSYGEGLPTVFIESMICGTPVLAYDCPTGPKEILGDGEYGKLIKMGDLKGTTDAMLELLRNEKYKEYQEKLDKRVEEFSDTNSINSLLKIIENLK